jgi:hypothetical protein
MNGTDGDTSSTGHINYGKCRLRDEEFHKNMHTVHKGRFVTITIISGHKNKKKIHGESLCVLWRTL